MSESNKTTLSFIEVSERLKSVELPEFDVVIGIGTGGLIPASLVAYQLGCNAEFIRINYRDESNTPRYEEPKLLSEISASYQGKRILIVDDVSVSGKTMDYAKSFFTNNEVKTLVLKGKGDYVLFPEIRTCVNWPWKELK
jgi:hypoxanthine phosphoribosyltransferase